MADSFQPLPPSPVIRVFREGTERKGQSPGESAGFLLIKALLKVFCGARSPQSMKWTCNTTWIPQSRPDNSGEHCWSAQIWVIRLGIHSSATFQSAALLSARMKWEWTQLLAELPPQAESQIPAIASEDWPLYWKGVVQSPATSPGEGEKIGRPARGWSGLRSSIASILWKATSGGDSWLGGRSRFGWDILIGTRGGGRKERKEKVRLGGKALD